MSRRLASRLVLPFVLTAAAIWNACQEPAAERIGRPFTAELARGAFFSSALWIDVRDLYVERAAQQLNDAWRVPATRYLVIEDGWGGPEDWGAWGLGESTRLRFYLPSVKPYDFFLRAMAADDPQGRTQSVTVRLNGRDVESWNVPRDWLERRFALPVDALRPGMNELELVYGFHIEGIEGHDDRPLALAFERLGLLPPDEEPGEERRGTGFLVQEERETLLLAAPGSYVVPIEVGPGDVAVEIETKALRRFMRSREMTLSAGVLDLEGREQVAFELDGDTGDDTLHRIPLEAYRGSQAFLFFTAVLAPGNRFLLRRPRLVSEEATGREATEEVKPPAGRPHVVLIVLDAARADHFGLYGYSRDTTPEIDRLGRESLVFTHAVAECSYTVCSMPSLLTGLSYVQHGLIGKHLFLGAEVETLAERLAAAGYLTVGYTGNPNNSTVTGMERGYEQFHEIWDTDPGQITGEVTKLLAAKSAERPLFLMLHYVPPHEPYDPTPEFDLFGDPSYAGPVNPDRDLAHAIYAKEVTLDEADLEELVALYDGNLRRGDAAVGEVLAALRGAGIYDDALVVVTSDHGEAFMEHGWIGHNTTLYGEMLRVPLVVKLPASWTAQGVATDRMVGLADVVATIDRRLGLDAPAQVRGQDLLAPASGGERVLFLRSAHAAFPYFGVRTRRFKAIIQEGRLPELYDVQADPGEERDLIAEHPLLHAGLMVLLSRAIKEDDKLRAGVREGDISEAQRKMLEALGYLGN